MKKIFVIKEKNVLENSEKLLSTFAYKDCDGVIIIKVIDEITECPFELKFNEDLGKLEIY